ncbi:MAG: riboflavin synthase [Veillonellaceae bacterium]|nr:riboflavin synthase [Veillonellaceae bacterium]
MFTGIIEEMGHISQVKRGSRSLVLTIQAQHVLEDVHIGDSIAVNGVCLTVTSFTKNSFTVDMMPESVAMTTLASALVGMPVNLERAMAANGRFGGHMVAGHVDGTGRITNIINNDNSVIFTITTSPDVLAYVIYKGSIAIDGTSLTVSKVTKNAFEVSIIPHTIAHTLLGQAKVGTLVNLETDMIGRYVRHFVQLGDAPLSEKGNKQERPNRQGLSKETLLENGFI